jgi:hypothetical protein
MNKLALVIVLVSSVPACVLDREDWAHDEDHGPGTGSGPCSSHSDCGKGCYCDGTSRTCRPGDRPADASTVSPPVIVVRDAGAALDAPNGSAPDAAGTGTQNLGDAGASCDAAPMSGSCTPRCRFAQQCGPGARCQAGNCQRACDGSTPCGTGAVCRDGFCQPDERTGGMCVYANQCSGGGSCINGYCHPACTRDLDCPNRADVCDRGICRPDQRPQPPCTASLQCSNGQSCVDGLCRPGCTCDADCAPWGAATLCLRGFCAAPEELAP